MSAPEWTVDRVLLEPKKAVALLNESARLHRDANKRINDLLTANNRYLERAQAAEAEIARWQERWERQASITDRAQDRADAAEVAGRSSTVPLTGAVLADALGCFWNAAIGEAHNRQGGMDVASIMAVGIAAIATRLTEDRK